MATLDERGTVRYIIKTKRFSQGDNSLLVYSLSMNGWRYAQKHHGIPIPASWKLSEVQITDYREHLHDLAITDTGIALVVRQG